MLIQSKGREGWSGWMRFCNKKLQFCFGQIWSIHSIVFGGTWVCPDRPAVRPIAFVAPQAGLLSRVSMWEHLQLRLADLDVCLLSRVRCGNSWETKGQKQHTGGFVIEALVNMANRPTCYSDHQGACFSVLWIYGKLWPCLRINVSNCISGEISEFNGMQI